MGGELVTYESRERIATITLNRPDKLNAITNEVGDALLAAWQRFNAGEDRVAILTGAGEKAFSAGADLDAPADFWRFSPGVGLEVEKPIVAAVNGICIGGAVVLVQFCDLCVASQNARFFYPEAKIGLTGGLISSLAARIPHKIAMEFILLGEELTAQRAYEAGLVNKVVPPGELMDAARQYAEKLAGMAPLVLTTLKRFVGSVLPKGPSELAGIARRDLERVAGSEDFREGVAGYKEKRPPRFVGR